MIDPRALALECISECVPSLKCSKTMLAEAHIDSTDLLIGTNEPIAIPIPGRPARPELVAPRELKHRKLTTLHGRVALVHAVAHIEFNAINLAWDAVYRFPGLPDAFYRDWASVAADEARHFSMLHDRLTDLGFAYGDFPAHNGLWQMAVDTAHDLVARMALVPRVLEARGLDVTPGMIERLLAAGDDDTVALLRIILAEEVRHVSIGSRWFKYVCEQQDLEPRSTFRAMLERYGMDRVRGPFNFPARMAAGFDAEEMAMLESLGA